MLPWPGDDIATAEALSRGTSSVDLMQSLAIAARFPTRQSRNPLFPLNRGDVAAPNCQRLQPVSQETSALFIIFNGLELARAVSHFSTFPRYRHLQDGARSEPQPRICQMLHPQCTSCTQQPGRARAKIVTSSPCTLEVSRPGSTTQRHVCLSRRAHDPRRVALRTAMLISAVFRLSS